MVRSNAVDRKKNFEEASMEIVDCPDLTQEPFKLAAKVKNLFKKRNFFKMFFL